MSRKSVSRDYYINYTLKGLKKREVLRKLAEEKEKFTKKQHLEVFLSTENYNEEEYV